MKMNLHNLGRKKGTGPICAKAGTDRRLVAGRSGKLALSRMALSWWFYAILTAGYSPAIGFIHTGKALSFVYDIADLYKVEMIVPLVSEVVAESDRNVERRARLACRSMFQQNRLLETILPDIAEVLHGRADSGASGPPGRPESVDDRAEERDIPRPYDSPPPG
jgi:hypothetical protein